MAQYSRLLLFPSFHCFLFLVMDRNGWFFGGSEFTIVMKQNACASTRAPFSKLIASIFILLHVLSLVLV
jgi:hypothetical protein